jgi:hypothetical protein
VRAPAARSDACTAAAAAGIRVIWNEARTHQGDGRESYGDMTQHDVSFPVSCDRDSGTAHPGGFLFSFDVAICRRRAATGREAAGGSRFACGPRMALRKMQQLSSRCVERSGLSSLAGDFRLRPL